MAGFVPAIHPVPHSQQLSGGFVWMPGIRSGMTAVCRVSGGLRAALHGAGPPVEEA